MTTKQVSPRIPIDLAERVQALANRNHVSFSRALALCLELGEQKMTAIYGGAILAYVNRPDAIHREDES